MTDEYFFKLQLKYSGRKVKTNYSSCPTCNHYLNSICSQMKPTEAEWFGQCIFEIYRFDGHVIAERYLRLYRVLSTARAKAK